MSKEKLSSVDFILKENTLMQMLSKDNIQSLVLAKYYIEVINKLKELHEWEIRSAYNDGKIANIMKYKKTSEQYYQEQFGDN